MTSSIDEQGKASAKAVAWAEAEAVAAALKANDVLELLSDHFAGVEDADDFRSSFSQPIAEIASALETRRDEALDTAVRSLSFESEEDELNYRDELDCWVPKVEGLLSDARAARSWALDFGR